MLILLVIFIRQTRTEIAEVIPLGNMRFLSYLESVMISVVFLCILFLFTYSTRGKTKFMSSANDGVIPFVVTLCLGKS